MLRLAFSVQVAVQPDILIVDEALAVGDVYFQAKCMRRIRSMLDTGTTLLFVSHSMSAVREVCSRGILLQSGRVVVDGTSGEAAQRYLSQELARNGQVCSDAEASFEASVTFDDPSSIEEPASAAPPLQRMDNLMQGAETFARKAASERIQNGKAQFVNVQLLNGNGELADVFSFGETATCRMLIDVLKPLPALWVGFHVRTVSGIDAVHVDSNLAGRLDYRFATGRRYVIDWPLELRLQHGPYYVMCALAIPDALDTTQPVYEYVDVVNHAFDFAVSPRFGGMIGGLVAPHSRCEIVESGPCDYSLS